MRKFMVAVDIAKIVTRYIEVEAEDEYGAVIAGKELIKEVDVFMEDNPVSDEEWGDADVHYLDVSFEGDCGE